MRATRALSLLCGSILAAFSAHADDWTVRTTLYGWIPGFSGVIEKGGQGADIDLSPTDTLDESETTLWGLMAYTEAHNGQYGAYLDILYANLEFGGSEIRNGTRFPGLSVGANANLESNINIIEFGGIYQFTRWGGNTGGGYTALEGILGGRYVELEADLALDITGAINLPSFGLVQEGNLAIARSGTQEWWDPLIGVRLRYQFAGGDRIGLRGDIGGFGVGSEFTWQLLATYSADFHIGSSLWSFVIGYRVLDIDYDEGAGLNQFVFDATIHGPVLGLTFRW